MDRTLAIKKVKAYVENPELIKEPTMGEMADLVTMVLGAVNQIEQAIKEGRLDGKTPEADKDYISAETMRRMIQSEVNRMLEKADSVLSETSSEMDRRVQQALQNIRNGKDGIVTEEEIARAAELASLLIEKPDFDLMLTDTVQGNGAIIRDALESLPEGEEQLKIEAIQGLKDKLQELENKIGLGNIKTFGGGVHLLRHLNDVNVEDIADGETLVWNATLQRFEPGTISGSGIGDVVKVGTPVNNQVGVWTGNGTLEGDAALTFDTTTDTLTIGSTAGIVVTHSAKADGSDGLLIEANNGTDVAILGAGNTANATFYGGVNIDGSTRLATSLTGVLRADSGVVSTDSDVTDIVAAASSTAAGKVELATDAETVTGTDTARATTPANVTARLAAPGTIGGTTPGAATFTTVTTTGNVELGHASDTTVARSSAGIISVEGNPIPRVFSGAGVPGTTPGQVGDIYIDTTNDNAYIAVGTASSADWEISNDGAGGGSGDVTKVGTPVNNQIGVWTGDGTIEGDASLTFDTSTDILATPKATVSPDTATALSTFATGAGGALAPNFQVLGSANSASIGFARFSSTGTVSPRFAVAKSRGTAIGDYTVVQSGDLLGEFAWNGSDGTDFTAAAAIAGYVDGTPGNNDMPGRLVFSTTADGASSVTDRIIIDSAGALKPATNDGSALGNTTNQFSDLFLAEGGVINWDNGDATITQSGNTITVAGITALDTGTSTALTAGTIELGAASDTTISRSSAGVIAVEGNTVITGNMAASAANINTGTSTTVFNTPDALAGSNFGIRYVAVTLNGTTALTTSEKAYFRIPAALNGMNLVSVAATVGTGAAGSSSSGTPTFTVKNVTDNNQMLSTSLTVDASEYTSATAATAAVINTSFDDVATDDLIEVAVTTSGTGVTYATVTMGFQLP